MTLTTVAGYTLLMFVPTYLMLSYLTLKYVVYTPDTMLSYYNGLKTYTVESHHAFLFEAKAKARALEEAGTPAIVGKILKGQ